MLIQCLLRAFQIVLGSFQMKCSAVGRTGLFRYGDSLAGIAHFLHWRRRFAGGNIEQHGQQQALENGMKSGKLHGCSYIYRRRIRLHKLAIAKARRQAILRA